jgi:hypothetical protein
MSGQSESQIASALRAARATSSSRSLFLDEDGECDLETPEKLL